MKKLLLWTWIVLLTPVLLFLVLMVLLYLPPVQNFAVQRVASFMSERTGTDVGVKRVTLRFPLDLNVKGVRFIMPNDSLPQVRDTVADVENVVANVKLMPLFHKRVVVKELSVAKAKINTSSLIASARVSGYVDQFRVDSRGIDLEAQTVEIDHVRLSQVHVDVALSDTVPPDTTSSKVEWLIRIAQARVDDSDITVHMPGDTLQIAARLGRVSLDDALCDLGRQSYTVSRFRWNDGAVGYDNRFEPRLKGLDFNHVSLSEIGVAIDSVSYRDDALSMKLSSCSLVEKSGLRVNRLETSVRLDSMRVELPCLLLVTPDSRLEAVCRMDMNAFDKEHPGNAYLRLLASVGKQDILRFAGGALKALPSDFMRRYPNAPLNVKMSVNGNMRHVDLNGLDLSLPTAFHASARGSVTHPASVKRMRADISMKAQTWNLWFVSSLLPKSLSRQFRLPALKMESRVKAVGQHYAVQMAVSEGRGRLAVKGDYHAANDAYQAKVEVKDVNVRHFMPRDSIGLVNASLSARGAGFDFLSRRTRMNAEARLGQLQIGHSDIRDIRLNALLERGNGHVTVEGDNDMIDGTLTLDALMSTRRVDATLGGDIRWADLHMMRLTEQPVVASLCAHVDVRSDLRESHKLQAFVNDMTVRTTKKTYRPEDLTVDISTDRDTTWAYINSGNLKLDLSAKGGYKHLMRQGERIMEEMKDQTRNKVIDQQRLRDLLPTLDIHLLSGDDNPFANFLRFKGIQFHDLAFDFKSSPSYGMSGDGHVYSLIADSVRLDTIAFGIRQEDSIVRFGAKVQNNKKNPQFVFKTVFNGYMDGKEVGLESKYYDAAGKLGISCGAKAEMCDSGINVHLTPYRPLLGYKSFSLNEDNFVFLGRDRKIKANINLIADDGTGVQVFSEDQDPDMLQDLTVSLNKFDLDKITAVIPYVPHISGLLNGDYHVLQNKEERLSVVSDMSISDMYYEGCRIGTIGSEFVYLQEEGDAHKVESRFTRDGRDIALLDGTYRNEGEGALDAKLDLMRTPLSMVNGFIPDQLLGFEGFAEGQLKVDGALSKLQVNGEVYLDSTYVKSVPYGVTLRCDNDPVRIVGSNLLLENFSLYGSNDSPLNLQGNVDFSDMDNMKLNLKMRAQNYQVIDAKKSSKSIAYGKAFVNFYANVAGKLDELKMRGQLDVLGSTNMTYVLKDSPLNTDDKMKDLVTFTDFRDTTQVAKVNRPAVGGLEMFMLMNIESGVQVRCALNADQSNYVDIEGGGELRMTYDDMDGMQLFGRYTINSGEMKYQLPVIPLKTFQIGEGSYVEFTGDMMNPRLNLTATEENKAVVAAESGGNDRTVLFKCGVKVTKTLQNMGLEFTLDAPEDLTVKNELATMSVEDRAKLAVTMLTTGMYLNDNNASNLTMNSALNSFLQSEINSITKNAMRTFDLSLGLDQNQDGAGNTTTDYSFKFSKKFWNNRFSFVIGGKVSASNNSSKSNTETFIDNVSLEYRLDQSAQRYVRLFYNKDTRDLFEDDISEYGAGFVWRKKLSTLSDLFRFKTASGGTALRQSADSIMRNEKKAK